MKIIKDIDQLSIEWFTLRAGLPSASCFDMILTPTGQVSKQREKYLYQLAGERITKTKTETYTSWAMQEGVVKESKARLMFEMIHDVEVEEVAFCLDDSEKFGFSPDGLLPGGSGLEIKAPLITTQVEYLLVDKLPTKYIPQVQGAMMVSGFSHYFFMSYFPGMPPLIKKVERDEKYIATLKGELLSFTEELDELEKKLRSME